MTINTIKMRTIFVFTIVLVAVLVGTTTVAHSPAIRHDIQDFCVRELGVLGWQGGPVVA
jgi:hypothetical protein